jgi:hypothetical protein
MFFEIGGGISITCHHLASLAIHLSIFGLPGREPVDIAVVHAKGRSERRRFKK